MKYLKPWQGKSDRYFVLCPLGTDRPLIEILMDELISSGKQRYTTNGMNPIFSTVGPFNYPSLEEAKQFVESILVKRGFILLNEEQASKLELLI